MTRGKERTVKERFLVAKVDGDTLEAVRVAAFQLRITKSGVVRRAVERFLKSHARRTRRSAEPPK